jgi:hypothetical protein
MEGWAGALGPQGMSEKLNSPPRPSALACRARLPYTLRRDPWASEASRALHRHRGGPNFKNAPAITSALLVDLNIIDVYIDWY